MKRSKKIWKAVLCLCLCAGLGLAVTACGQDKSSGSGAKDGDYSSVDLDLTKMSSTMVYSEVYDMMYTPKKYVGKTVKMKGEFNTMYDEEEDKLLYACIIQDATACCAQGIEFELAKTPEQYPEGGSEVTVAGVFETIDLDGEPYGVLKQAKFIEE